MPLVGVEEVEDLLERPVGDVDVRVVALQVVNVEQAAVEVGDATEQLRQRRIAVGLWLSQPFVEQPAQEQAVEAVELAAAFGLRHGGEAIAEVVRVVVQEAALLDKVDEHHAVQHQRGVPLAVGHVPDALDEAEKRLMLLLETVVEALGHLLHVERLGDPRGGVRDGEALLFFESEAQVFELLRQRFGTLPAVVGLLPVAVALARFALHPLPALGGVVLRRKDDQVFVGRLGEDAVDLLSRRIVRQARPPVDALVGDQAALVGDGFELERPLADGDGNVAAALIPSEILNEQRFQIEFIQQPPDGGSVERG